MVIGEEELDDVRGLKLSFGPAPCVVFLSFSNGKRKSQAREHGREAEVGRGTNGWENQLDFVASEVLAKLTSVEYGNQVWLYFQLP